MTELDPFDRAPRLDLPLQKLDAVKPGLLERVPGLTSRGQRIGAANHDAPQGGERRRVDGARLVQLYSGLVFQGPQLIRDIIAATSAAGDRESGGSPPIVRSP